VYNSAIHAIQGGTKLFDAGIIIAAARDGLSHSFSFLI
jgi:hypothetical protein